MKKGQIFTPQYIVDYMIQYVDFSNIKKSLILEPSFGDGVFLIKILNILISKLKRNIISKEEFYFILNNNIYGVELDKKLYLKTINNLNNILIKNNLKLVKWNNLYNEDFITFNTKIKFNYIIGNPPYIKTHDISKNKLSILKKYNFTKGTTDMYIFFFEKCINLLNKNGKLIFITPNSYFKNTSQKTFRSFLLDNKLITNIIDFESNLIFKNILTYTAITILDKQNNNNYLNYKRSDGKKIISNTKYEYSNLKDIWYFHDDKKFINLRINNKHKLGDFINCQYGVSTNRDKIYIIDTHNISLLSNNYIRPAIKASRYNGQSSTFIIYPYKNGEIVKEENLKQSPFLYNYLMIHKKELLKRNMEKNSKWYAFGRTQGIKNMDNYKLTFKHIISESSDRLKVYKLKPNYVIYSGLYITSKYNLNIIKDILETDDFLNYIKIVGKNMQNNYKSISSKQVLNYGLTNKEIELIKMSINKTP